MLLKFKNPKSNHTVSINKKDKEKIIKYIIDNAHKIGKGYFTL